MGHEHTLFRYTSSYAIGVHHRKAVSSIPTQDKLHSIQHYVIKVCQWLVEGQWFSPGTPVSSTNKTDHHDIAEL
jgi:hypothetical protein